MTRITDFGRKRTHVQAGFPDNSEPVEEQAEPHASTSTLPSESQPHDQVPPKKKRKRTKKPKENGDEKADEDKAQDAGSSETAKVVPKKKLKDKRKPKTRPDPAQRSESRRQKRIAEKYADTTCFACRRKGHTARDCPTIRNEASGGGGVARQKTVGICYRCGSNQHTLSRCKAPEDPHHPLPFASCFVCSGKGHLASSCPQNKDKGVYPNGGCCKLCRETSHLAKDCGLRKQVQSGTATFVGTGQSAGADEDDFHTFKRRNADVDSDIKKDERAKKKADVKFASYTGTVKAFGTPVGNSAKVKVVYF
ncbi:uncharacterized protein BJ212DRAFT_469695 [Suillus subaureus]|uniref:CCHC-type domain-containing protein n=1 Tax=Suillus subaureus TaxID=48587 RepID=A0A9P7JB43_9AGAM|nr:uncharacterized protein BJ212DRAFT_469695 [Suillus subaureus]KAG1812077.1 hypothetical protein BJ212DRAFT_469695 [Suillus subaureus]